MRLRVYEMGDQHASSPLPQGKRGSAARPSRRGVRRKRGLDKFSARRLFRLTAAGLRDVLPAKLLRHFRGFLRKFPRGDQDHLLQLLRALRHSIGDLAGGAG
jgi:hypothetical protein